MRGWLNTFRMTVFTPEELELFQTTEVPADSNPYYSTDAGNKTRDSIFLLSVEEVLQYLPTDAGKGFGTAWWLRTPGDHGNYTACVNADGSINYAGELIYGSAGYSDGLAVRPAMWISIPDA